MAKNRKTRKDKIRSANRMSEAVLQTSEEHQTPPSTVTFNYQLPTISQRTHKPTATISHTHISQDLVKTLFITSTIVIAQVILFVLLQNR